MRRSSRLAALAGAFALLLCSCAPSPTPDPSPSPAGEESAAPSPEVVPSEAPVTVTPGLAEASVGEPPLWDWIKDRPVPDFLEEEQQALFLHAFTAATFLMGCSTSSVSEFPLADGSLPDADLLNSAEYLELPGTPEGWHYREAVGRYARWEDFRAMAEELFTPEYLEQLLNFAADGTVYPIFTSTGDGRLCYLEMDRGGSLEYGWCDTPDSYELVSQGSNEIVFDLIGHYAQLGPDDGTGVPSVEGEYTEAYPIRMVKTDNGWRFSEFHLPY